MSWDHCPVIDVVRRKKRFKGDVEQFVFVRPCICGAKHRHGAFPGHRVAHCPYEAKRRHENGYILREVDRKGIPVRPIN